MQSFGYFHDRDASIQLSLPWQSHTLVSISTLKSLLRVIRVIPLKPQVSPIVGIGI